MNTYRRHTSLVTRRYPSAVRYLVLRTESDAPVVHGTRRGSTRREFLHARLSTWKATRFNRLGMRMVSPSCYARQAPEVSHIIATEPIRANLATKMPPTGLGVPKRFTGLNPKESLFY